MASPPARPAGQTPREPSHNLIVGNGEVKGLRDQATARRHDFLQGQLDDVKETRRELNKVIKAIDEEIVNVFAAAFADGTLETEFLNHTSAGTAGDARGYLRSQLRLRRGTANHIAFEELQSATGSGFQFAAEAFATVVQAQDHAAVARATQASLDIATTLEALALSARRQQWVDLSELTGG